MPRIQLVDLYPRVLHLIQSPDCDQVIKAWIFAITFSLRAAEKLGYETAEFHEKEPQEVQEALEKAFSTLIVDSSEKDVVPPLYAMSPDDKKWLAGYLYNSAVLRMAGLIERGLKILWERINVIEDAPIRIARNAVGDYHYGQLIEWYVCIFIGLKKGRPNYKQVETLDLVRQQANDFKHDHTSVQLRSMRTMDAAVDAFSNLLQLLEKTIEDRDTLLTRQMRSRWWKENALYR